MDVEDELGAPGKQPRLVGAPVLRIIMPDAVAAAPVFRGGLRPVTGCTLAYFNPMLYGIASITWSMEKLAGLHRGGNFWKVLRKFAT
jgi:hypothetical protein